MKYIFLSSIAVFIMNCGPKTQTQLADCTVQQYPTSAVITCPDGSQAVVTEPSPTPTPTIECKHKKCEVNREV